MCLRNVTFSAVTKSGEFVGYKVMNKSFNKNCFTNTISQRHRVYYKNRWYKAKVIKIGSVINNDYLSGFHIYLKYEDAKKHQKYWGGSDIVQVRFKTVLGFGKQKVGYRGDFTPKTANCVIAKSMKVLGVVENERKSKRKAD